MNIKQILEISDPGDMVPALSEYIAIKCDYGDNMAALSGPERVFYITQALEMEVNNGGFSQFFYNSSGDFANELVSAFTTIGALHTVPICEKALSAFGCEIPADRDAREDMLDETDCDAVDEILNECDEAFYAYEDDLDALNYAYVIKHSSSFT